ncbi:uncharacterized protein LOC121738862 [Aricia agestis]|uniref:uncharacterized protein LOC121738862 n=1 Tax=Aricia agestis TaxID=91739 RepID=UPI001C207E16|nr:uncharacterized protein LOC121738862 [Aricia agestis]
MANRPCYAQLESLAEFLEQNPGIAKGLLRTSQGKMETKRKWANLAISLNSLGGANKTGEGWAKYWAEKKCVLKKQCAQLAASLRRTGGGTADNLPALSALDNRMVAVMGGHQFAMSDSRFTVDPFPQRTTPTELPIVIEIAEEPSHNTTDTEMNLPSPIPSTSHIAIHL